MKQDTLHEEKLEKDEMNSRRKLTLILLGLVLLVSFGLPTPGRAQGIIFGDSVGQGQVVDNNIVLNGTDVSIDGTVNGDVMAFGQTVTVNGLVNGNLISTAETIVINGEVTNNVWAASIRMELGPEAQIGRDLYYTGARLVLTDGSTITRDLYSLGLEAQVSGNIGRDIRVIIGPLQIAELILNPFRDRITVIGAAQPGNAGQANTPQLAGIGSGVLGPAGSWLSRDFRNAQQGGQIDTERLGEWGTALLKNLVAFLVLGLLGIWLVPAPLNWAAEDIRKKPGLSALTGLLFLVIGWFVALVVLLLVVMLALFFYSLSLPNLGFLVGSMGLLGVGLAAVMLWFSSVYLSKVIVALWVGRLILQRFAPKYAQGNLWPLLLGVVLYVLIASIPYLGWVVATLATFFGLGGLWAVLSPFFPRRKDTDTMPSLATAD